MFALPGIIVLIGLTLLRPQEFVPELEGVPLLHIAIVLAILGLVVDLGTDRAKLRSTPVTPWALALLGWAAVTLLVASPSELTTAIQRLLIGVALCLVIAHGVHTPAALAAIGATILACSLGLAAIGIHQGLSPQQCLVAEETAGVPTAGVPDGRSCETRDDCYGTSETVPGATYLCEHVGLFGTTSIDGGRVRYRGELGDPNELALTLGAALPLAYVSPRPDRRVRRWLLLLASAALVAICIALTGSRGGMLATLAVLLCAFAATGRVRTAVVTALLAIPAIVLASRTGEGASSSTTERLESWAAALEMFRGHPVAGVGHAMFTAHHYLTAHNAYLLAAAEMGLVGLFLFLGLLYASGRILWSGVRYYDAVGSPPRAWAIALLAALGGLIVGMFFLSFTYHHVLWMFMGLCGAYYNVARHADPDFRVRLRAVDFAAIGGLVLGVLVLLLALTRFTPQ